MSQITLRMKDGTVREFMPEPRSGGSYTKRLSHRGAFVCITDEWGITTMIPAADIAQIEERPDRPFGW